MQTSQPAKPAARTSGVRLMLIPYEIISIHMSQAQLAAEVGLDDQAGSK